ncbi:hypothetical protein GCM10017688_03530 [Streptomyces ramulosus]
MRTPRTRRGVRGGSPAAGRRGAGPRQGAGDAAARALRNGPPGPGKAQAGAAPAAAAPARTGQLFGAMTTAVP